MFSFFLRQDARQRQWHDGKDTRRRMALPLLISCQRNWQGTPDGRNLVAKYLNRVGLTIGKFGKLFKREEKREEERREEVIYRG